MLPLDLELLILSYTSFGEFIIFYDANSLETKIKACYKKLPNIYDIIEMGDLIGTKYLLNSDTNRVKYKLYQAIKCGHLDILDYLLTFYNIKNCNDIEISHAIRFKHIKILDYLIHKYNYIFEDHNFKEVVVTKNLDLIKWVIQKYPDQFEWIAELVLIDYPKLKIFKFAVSIGIKLTHMELSIANSCKRTEIAKYIESQL